MSTQMTFMQDNNSRIIEKNLVKTEQCWQYFEAKVAMLQHEINKKVLISDMKGNFKQLNDLLVIKFK